MFCPHRTKPAFAVASSGTHRWQEYQPSLVALLVAAAGSREVHLISGLDLAGILSERIISDVTPLVAAAGSCEVHLVGGLDLRGILCKGIVGNITLFWDLLTSSTGDRVN